MPTTPLPPLPDDDAPDETDERIARLEAELKESAKTLFTDAPDPGPIPEVLTKPTPSPAKQPSPDAGMWGMAKAWGTALDFIFTIVAGGLMGWGFDKWRGTEPKGVMVGIGLGFVVAFIRIVRSTLRQEREESRLREERRRSKP